MDKCRVSSAECGMRNAEWGVGNECQKPRTGFRTPYSALRTPHSALASADLVHFRSPVRTVIPILLVRLVGHAPLMSVPAVESVHLEEPEAGIQVADRDHAVPVADVDAVGAILLAALARR